MIGIGVSMGLSSYGSKSGQSILFQDYFNREDNVATLGTPYLTSQGNYGILNNRAYSATDVNGDMAYVTLPTHNYNISCLIRGTLNSASAFRVPAVMFNYLDNINLMFARPRNGVLELYKVLLGTATLLASPAVATPDDVELPISIKSQGNDITVMYNGTTLNYTLSGGDTVLSTYMGVGLRLSKGGAPTFAAYWDNLVVTS